MPETPEETATPQQLTLSYAALLERQARRFAKLAAAHAKNRDVEKWRVADKMARALDAGAAALSEKAKTL